LGSAQFMSVYVLTQRPCGVTQPREYKQATSTKARQDKNPRQKKNQ